MIALLVGLACAKGGLPTADIVVKDVSISVEVADEGTERQLGLMYRDRLGTNDGMLFVYPDAVERNFWMKDTRIPLSIAYLDAEGRIVRIADLVPFDTNPVPSGAPAQFALEMNRGWFVGHKIQVGDTVTHLPAAPSP